jgi:Leucine-rich repeat (LRR) protein
MIKQLKPFLILISFVFLGFNSNLIFAQPLDSASLASKPIYISLDEALKNPNQVYRLSLKKQKLKTVPLEIFKLTNLQELDLSKNKISEIPAGIENLTNLTILDISSNNLSTLPVEIAQCTYLKRLVLNRNNISDLPSSMGNLSHLEYLDLWSNLIVEMPQSFEKLVETLKELDLRVINMNDERQETLRTLLPKTIIHFSRSCNCN